MHPAFFPYLVGLIPIVLARSWAARIVALSFGAVSIGLGIRHVWAINNIPDQITGVDKVGSAVIGALCVAVVSVVVTYFVDKRQKTKAEQND
jgi:ABC-type anion transport system duplicated permease subunit